MQARFVQVGLAGTLRARLVVMSSLGALISACGGGGGGVTAPLVPEAVVTQVASAQVLETNIDASLLRFVATFDKPVERGVTIKYSTAPKYGATVTGSASGGVCGSGVDYKNEVDQTVTVRAGATSVELQVTVCGDTEFEPNELLTINWSADGKSGSGVVGTIVNDDAGGLNSTGVASLMNNTTAFGRDTNPLTSDSADGALGFAFEKTNDSACIKDAVTGLVWQTSVFANQTYAQAALAAQTSTSCNLTWRLPTVNELQSLMDYSLVGVNSSNADAGVSGLGSLAMAGEYWGEVAVTASATQAWVVAASNGAAGIVDQSEAKSVRLVSGTSSLSACNDSTRYVNFGNGTIEDTKVGLMWKQCPEGKTGSACDMATTIPFDSTKGTVVYLTEWLNSVNSSGSAQGLGYTDWRIPTVKELSSLADRCQKSGVNVAIDDLFPNTQSSSYVTANGNVNVSNEYWFVSFTNGDVGSGPLINKNLRLVRAGQ